MPFHIKKHLNVPVGLTQDFSKFSRTIFKGCNSIPGNKVLNVFLFSAFKSAPVSCFNVTYLSVEFNASLIPSGTGSSFCTLELTLDSMSAEVLLPRFSSSSQNSFSVLSMMCLCFLDPVQFFFLGKLPSFL